MCKDAGRTRIVYDSCEIMLYVRQEASDFDSMRLPTPPSLRSDIDIADGVYEYAYDAWAHELARQSCLTAGCLDSELL
jgi:hypothetical protein